MDGVPAAPRSSLKLLLVAASYPHPGAEWAGTFNERTALALQGLVKHVEVLVPRPYAPRLLAFNARWRSHGRVQGDEFRSGIRVHRPAYPVLPRIVQGFWPTRAAALFTRRRAAALHRAIGFDAILSFDLARTGGLAWRLGADLGIPACGWATGTDIRHDGRSSLGRAVREALGRLDLVFYQSRELKTLGASLLGTPAERLPEDRHIVQARGVAEPDVNPDPAARRSVRAAFQVADDDVAILYLGRMARGKGVFELVEAFARWPKARRPLALVLVGAIPGRDDSLELEKRIRGVAPTTGRVRMLPGCAPARIWDYFAAADIFAFPSFREGMPNSLLEAMLARLPAVAFAIPAVQEITRFGGGLVDLPPHDFASFGDAVMRLAADPERRRAIGERGRAIVLEHFSVHESMRRTVGHIARVTAHRRPS